MIAILLALAYWLFDSTLHYAVYGEAVFEIIPADTNELWMRSTILVLIIGFGMFADHHVNKLRKMEAEKHEIYIAMLDANHHILNNLLNNMLLFRLEAKKHAAFDNEIIRLFDQAIEETGRQIKSLENIRQPSRKIIEERYRPK